MIPVEELRAALGAAPTDDALLESLEQYAVAEVELTTGRYLGPAEDFTDQIIGDGSTELRLPRFPVSEVVSVEQSWLTDAVPAPVAVTDFVLRTPRLIRTAGGVWTRDAEFTVEYHAGYEDDEVPPIYRQAVLDIVAATFPVSKAMATATVDAGEFKSETFEEYSYTRADSGSAASGTPSAARASVAAILARLPRRIRV